MGEKISTTSMTPSVIVNVKEKVGQFFKGKLLVHKIAESQYKDDKTGGNKNFDIYEFLAEETDMRLQRKKGKEYMDVPETEEVSEVTVFAPTRLHNALSQIKPGERVKFTYLGLGKATRRGGKPHEYDVERLAEGE